MLPPIPGTRVQDPQWLRFLRGHVSELVQMNCRPSKFPGAQPVSFASHHIQELCEENYFVSEKADGVRCLMFTTRLRDGSGETFLIDRKNEYYKLDFGLMQADGSLHVDTLLDGELVFEAETDKQTGEQRQKLFFLFFDALVVDGKSLCDRPYTKRLGYLREFVVKPHLMHERKPEYTRNQPFRMVQKRLEMSYNIATVFEHMRGYKHKTDGVIFTSAVAPYMSGTCPKMLKWKPSEENTVDFKIISIGRGPTGSPEYRLGILESSDRHSDFGVLELDEELKDE
nr:Dcp1p-Dcp2p decapping enzyme complex alpha subunit [Polyrhizophydium stewartii]